MLIWNVCMQSKYPASTIIFDMSLTYICSAFVGVVLSNVLVEKLSLRVRITVGYILSFIVLLFITSSDIGGHAFSPTASYRITLVSVAVVALGCTGTHADHFNTHHYYIGTYVSISILQFNCTLLE